MLMRRKKALLLLTLLVIIVSLNSVVIANELTSIDISFREADLRDVFRALSELAGVNLITDTSVQGSVTVHFKDVSFIEALNLLTKANELDYEKVGSTYFIASQARLKELFTQDETQVFYLENADPEEIQKIIDKIDKDILVEIDKRLNAVIVTCEQKRLKEIQGLVKELDAPKALIVVDVRVEEISSTGLRDLGITSENLKESGLHFLRGSDGSINIDFKFPDFLRFLEEEGLAYNLANPRLTTVDGERGHLHIGDRIPVRVKEEISYLEAGILIEYTARASRDGYITMNVSPQVSTIGEDLTEGFPHIRTRQADTEIRIKSGDTFAIGGLMQTQEIDTVGKVPFLGELPLLGQLFRRNRKELIETELVIFIKATAIMPEDNELLVEKVTEPTLTVQEEKELLKQVAKETENQKPKAPKQDIPPHIARWLELFAEGKPLTEDEEEEEANVAHYSPSETELAEIAFIEELIILDKMKTKAKEQAEILIDEDSISQFILK